MDPSGKAFISKRIIHYETGGFAIILLVLWLDELIDLPRWLLGAAATPVNWRESLFESAGILILGAAIIRFTRKMFEKMKYLEGILPVCAACKKIRDESGGWHHIESYISEKSDAKFSHSICPECAEKLYPKFNPYRKKQK